MYISKYMQLHTSSPSLCRTVYAAHVTALLGPARLSPLVSRLSRRQWDFSAPPPDCSYQIRRADATRDVRGERGPDLAVT